MKEKTKIILTMIISVIVTLTLTVTASLVTSATNITFTSDKTDKTNVSEALDELYSLPTNSTIYTESNPRTEGTIQSYSGNIVWVGSINHYLSLKLKETDRKIQISTSGTSLPFTVKLDGESIDSFITDGTNETIKTYDLSNNTSFLISSAKNLYGDVTVIWYYKIW